VRKQTSDRFDILTPISEEVIDKATQKLMRKVRKMRKRKVRKVRIYGASQLRGVAALVKELVPTADVCGTVWPGARAHTVCKGVSRVGAGLKENDFVVLSCGTNDVAAGKGEEFLEEVRRLLPELSRTNVVVCSVPGRHDTGAM